MGKECEGERVGSKIENIGVERRGGELRWIVM
jgi:hypothetical protein